MDGGFQVRNLLASRGPLFLGAFAVRLWRWQLLLMKPQARTARVCDGCMNECPPQQITKKGLGKKRKKKQSWFSGILGLCFSSSLFKETFIPKPNHCCQKTIFQFHPCAARLLPLLQLLWRQTLPALNHGIRPLFSDHKHFSTVEFYSRSLHLQMPKKSFGQKLSSSLLIHYYRCVFLKAQWPTSTN